jgi:selenocysteine lyase/cysteine desulfurase
MREGLQEMADLGVTLQDRGARKSGIVTFAHATVEAPEIVGRLAEQGINMRVAEQTFRYDGGVRPRLRVRASVHYYNTEEEIDRAFRALAALLP